MYQKTESQLRNNLLIFDESTVRTIKKQHRVDQTELKADWINLGRLR